MRQLGSQGTSSARYAGKMVAMGVEDKVLLLESFSSLWQVAGPSLLHGAAGAQRVPLAEVLLHCSAHQARQGHPL